MRLVRNRIPVTVYDFSRSAEVQTVHASLICGFLTSVHGTINATAKEDFLPVLVSVRSQPVGNYLCSNQLLNGDSATISDVLKSRIGVDCKGLHELSVSDPLASLVTRFLALSYLENNRHETTILII